MKQRLEAFLLMSAVLMTGVSSVAVCQSFTLGRGKTIAFDWQVHSAQSYLLVDPNPNLTLFNRFRIGARLGLGFFTFQSRYSFQHVLGVDFAFDRLSVSAAFVNTPIQLGFTEEGQTLSRGLAAAASYVATSDLTLKSRWFYGLIETGNHDEPWGYYGIVEADTMLWLDFQNKIEPRVVVSLAGSPTAESRRYGVSLSLPITLFGGDLQLVPFMGYLQTSAATGSYLDDLGYDFSSFTYGPLTSDTVGNTAAVVNALWRIHPFAGTNLYPIQTIYVGPALDVALVCSPSDPFTKPMTAFTAGGVVGIELFGVHFEVRFGYRSDVKSHFVWSFRVQ